MAAFVFKRTGFGSGPRGRKATIPDAVMTRVLTAYKATYGPTLSDDEVTDKIFEGFVETMLNHSNSRGQMAAAKAVVKDAADVVADNT